VYNERKRLKDNSQSEIFGRKAVTSVDTDDKSETGEADDKEAPDKESKWLNELLSAETTGRGRPKALCNQDVLLMAVRHPVTGGHTLAMAIKLIHHKGSDDKPRPYAPINSRAELPFADRYQDHLPLHPHQEVDLLFRHSYRRPCTARQGLRCAEVDRRRSRAWRQDSGFYPMHSAALDAIHAQDPDLSPLVS